jgi:hypothetical protein
MRLKNKVRYWTNEEYRQKTIKKSLSRRDDAKKYRELVKEGKIIE